MSGSMNVATDWLVHSRACGAGARSAGTAAPNDGDEQEVLRRLARRAAGLSGADIERQAARCARRPLAYADIETLLARASGEVARHAPPHCRA